MDYRLEAEKIVEAIEAGHTISAIKLVRTVTFDGLKQCKAVVNYINREIGKLGNIPIEVAGYLEIRRMTSESCFGMMRTYALGNADEYNSAVDHLSIILDHERAVGVIDGVFRIRGLQRGERVTITLVSSCSYNISYV